MSLSLITNEQILKERSHRWRKFCLDIDVWESESHIERSFDWKTVDFKKSHSQDLPDTKGIYFFRLKASFKLFGDIPYSFILYIGETTNLKQRFLQYFNYVNDSHPSNLLKRTMILLYKEYLSFNYCEINELSDEERTALEYKLIDLIIPPFNSKVKAEAIKETIKLYRDY